MENLVMAAAEICREYRLSKDKSKQIGVLADLNCCSKADIARLLFREGETVPSYYDYAVKDIKAPGTKKTETKKEARKTEMKKTEAKRWQEPAKNPNLRW